MVAPFLCSLLFSAFFFCQCNATTPACSVIEKCCKNADVFDCNTMGHKGSDPRPHRNGNGYNMGDNHHSNDVRFVDGARRRRDVDEGSGHFRDVHPEALSPISLHDLPQQDEQTFGGSGLPYHRNNDLDVKFRSNLTLGGDNKKVGEIKINKKKERCTCNDQCVSRGLCCDDYFEYCDVTDCKMSEWRAPEGCVPKIFADSGFTIDKPPICGYGTMGQRRDIYTPPKAGGAPCGQSNRIFACYEANNQCDMQYAEHAKLANWESITQKVINPDQAVGSEYVVNTYYSENVADATDGYCIVFTVDAVMSPCANARPSLAQSNDICVQCRSSISSQHAQNRCWGDGLERILTRFKKMDNIKSSKVTFCSGMVKRKSRKDNCNCKNDYSNLDAYFFL